MFSCKKLPAIHQVQEIGLALCPNAPNVLMAYQKIEFWIEIYHATNLSIDLGWTITVYGCCPDPFPSVTLEVHAS